jgi:sugar phosphate isomerase/epimerase
MDRDLNPASFSARAGLAAHGELARAAPVPDSRRSTMSECRDAIGARNGIFRLSRRGLIQVALGAGLGLAGPSIVRAEDKSDLRARARKNLKLGIMSSVYSDLPIDEAARRIKADGFSGVVTDFTFADVHFNPLEPDWAAARKIVSTLERAGIEIVSLFGYYNVVDPDLKKRKLGAARIEALLSNGKRLGCHLVSTETGTFNSQSEWLDSPENQTEQGYLQCKSALEKHTRVAEKHGAVLSIEAYYRNIIGTIDRAERLFRDVHSPALRLVMDPCNYFRREDLPRMKPMLEAMFQRLGDQIVIAHAKDVKASPEGEDLPAAGLGVLDYPLFLRLLAQLDRPLPLVVEHLRRPDVARARKFVLDQFEQI